MELVKKLQTFCSPEYPAGKLMQEAAQKIQEQQDLLAHFRQCIDAVALNKGTIYDAMPHSELASEVRMLSRDDLHHEAVVTAARNRILYLADLAEKRQQDMAAAVTRLRRALDLARSCLRQFSTDMEEKLRAIHKDMPPPKNRNTLLKVAGKSFRCPCGANVFTDLGDGIYRCNGCGTEYTSN